MEVRPRHALYVLECEESISVQLTVKVAEATRRELLRRCPGSLFGGKISGVPRGDGHQHLHVLPQAEGETVRRLSLWAPSGFGRDEMAVLRSSISVPASGPLPPFRLLPWSSEVPREEGTRWRSATPYVPTRREKKDGREESTLQIARECALRGFPEPQVQLLGPAPGWATHRPGQSSPAGRPAFYQLTFPTPVRGPLCLGANSHFGLGRFVPHEG